MSSYTGSLEDKIDDLSEEIEKLQAQLKEKDKLLREAVELLHGALVDLINTGCEDNIDDFLRSPDVKPYLEQMKKNDPYMGRKK